MSTDPSKTVENSGTDPDKGMKTRPYLVSVLIALVVILLVVFLIAHGSADKFKGRKAIDPTSGKSSPTQP